MVQLIAGKKGKGKTKHLLDKVNTEIKTVQGNVVYLDKSTKHMFELNNKIRLINVSDYLITNSDEFVGFISGIISQDHDLQQMYFDSFLKIACLEGSDISNTIAKLEEISDKFHIDFTLSISLDENELPEGVRSKVIISL
jgi:phenylalanyl-tRNA synthetase beta subunit